MLSGTLGHYRIVRLIGRGGMGEVYLADDTLLGRQVALKILPPELSAGDRRERFDREARAVAALNHPNIVTLHSIDQAADTPFLTMEFVDGKGLGELIPATGLPLDRLLKIAIPLADAVGAAHQRGILHRDLKAGQRHGHRRRTFTAGHDAEIDTTDPADDGRPSVSPDGRSIAFVSNRQDGERIWVMHTDGSNPRLVGSVAGMNPFWTPDSASILFTASTGTSQVNVDGTGERSLADHWPPRRGEAAKTFIARAISRQGMVAGFEVVDPLRGGGWRLAFAPLDAAAPVTTLERTTATTLTEIGWAPDGKAIDLMVGPDAGNIWRYPIDGTKGFRLTAFAGTAVTRSFAWSANGRLLISRGDNKTDLVLFKRAGGR